MEFVEEVRTMLDRLTLEGTDTRQAKSNLSAAWTTSTEPADGKLSRAGQWVFSALAPGEELVVMVEEHVVRGYVSIPDPDLRLFAILLGIAGHVLRDRYSEDRSYSSTLFQRMGSGTLTLRL